MGGGALYLCFKNAAIASFAATKDVVEVTNFWSTKSINLSCHRHEFTTKSPVLIPIYLRLKTDRKFYQLSEVRIIFCP